MKRREQGLYCVLGGQRTRLSLHQTGVRYGVLCKSTPAVFRRTPGLVKFSFILLALDGVSWHT